MGDVIDAMLELWNGGDVTGIDGVYTDPVRLGGIERPRSEVARVLATSRRAFPDQRYAVEDRVDGDGRVALRLRWSGTHPGSWQSWFGQIPATRRRFSLTVMELYELHENRIAGAWVGFDIRELLRQLGVDLVLRDPT